MGYHHLTLVNIDNMHGSYIAEYLALPAEQFSVSSITCRFCHTNLLAYFMGNPTSGGQKSSATALLVIIPPVLIVAVAIAAIKCSEWYPRLQGKIVSWCHRSHLPCLRKRSGSDPPEGPPGAGRSIPREDEFARQQQPWSSIRHFHPFVGVADHGTRQTGV